MSAEIDLCPYCGSLPCDQTDTPASAAKGEAVALTFGAGRLVVDTGTYHGQPAVFVCPVPSPGTVGENAAHLGLDRHSLLPSEQVMTFPTAEQARRVADALVNLQPQPSQQAGTEGISREHLVLILRELITEQSEGEWGDATIHKDADRFATRILSTLTSEVKPEPLTDGERD